MRRETGGKASHTLMSRIPSPRTSGVPRLLSFHDCTSCFSQWRRSPRLKVRDAEVGKLHPKQDLICALDRAHGGPHRHRGKASNPLHCLPLSFLNFFHMHIELLSNMIGHGRRRNSYVPTVFGFGISRAKLEVHIHVVQLHMSSSGRTQSGVETFEGVGYIGI